MKEEWRVQAKTADFKGLGARFHIDQVIARVIRNRGICTEAEYEEYLGGDLKSLHSPYLMKDMKKAVSLIKKAIEEKKPIRIIGDYDIDGINSIYILYSGLKRLGADVDYIVPHRITDGYGINEHLIQNAYDEGRQVLITCDNGIAAASQVRYAKELGMQVIVTDHHDVPFEMVVGKKHYIVPEADAVVDPKQEDCTYPFKLICGAVVGYKLIEALFAGYGRPAEEVYDFIEFAAIATVGDVVDLQGENRTIVRHGLKKLKISRNQGLNALIDINELKREAISAYHIGFVIGPCLNASGRLDTAMKAIEMLLTKDQEKAERLAGDLKALNDERKALTLEGVTKAVDMVENTDIYDDMVLVLYLEGCHESIVGIIAGKIRERYNKPVIVFADGEGCLKGSGRSTPAYNMFDKISECKELLEKFGGHPMAAGMSIKKENLELFRKALNDHSGMTESDLILKIWIDVAMPFDYISEPLVEQLSLLEPFGKGNEKPIFAERNLIIRNLKHIGKMENFTKLVFEKENGLRMDGIIFDINPVLERCYIEKKKVNILYYPSINEYKDKRTIQVTVISAMEKA